MWPLTGLASSTPSDPPLQNVLKSLRKGRHLTACGRVTVTEGTFPWDGSIFVASSHPALQIRLWPNGRQENHREAMGHRDRPKSDFALTSNHAPRALGPAGVDAIRMAERFIQTLTNGWAYGAIYGSSTERTAALPGWLDHYNVRRRHGSLGHRPPPARLAELEQPRG
jgi:Integrase core domain